MTYIHTYIYLNSPYFSVSENILGHFSADIFFSEKRAVSQKRSSRNPVSFEEQIMSKDKYPNIFSATMAGILFVINKCFSQYLDFLKLGNITWIFPTLSWVAFNRVMRLENNARAKIFDGL